MYKTAVHNRFNSIKESIKTKIMKSLKIALSLIILLYFFQSQQLFAQHFVIDGYVYESASGTVKANHPVKIIADSNTTTPFYVNTVYTNANGYYTDTIIDGAIIGANRKYVALSIDTCSNSEMRDTVQNMQGTVSYANVNFTMSCVTCPVGFQSYTTAVMGGVKFNASPSDTTASYYWDFGDGESSTLISPEHFYTRKGKYYACLTFDNNMGCISSFCDTVYVSNGFNSCTQNNAYAKYTFQEAGNPFTLEFETTNVPANTFYFWDFGDGTSSGNSTPTHTFPQNPVGVNSTDYKVCLSVYNSSAVTCVDRYCEVINIADTIPNSNCSANWSASRNTSGTYDFTALNGTSNSIYSWEFGDRATSRDRAPKHSYNQSGTYTVCLTVSENGCTDTHCDSLQVVVSNPNCIDPTIIDTQSTCLTVIDYVCGCDGVTYNNSCEAYYFYGVSSWTAGPCSQNNQYAFSGIVTKGLNSIAQSAIVYLIQADSTANGVVLSLVDSQYTSPQGYYSFNNIPSGLYYLKAALTPNDVDYAGYMPTYFDVSLFWAYASPVYANANQNNLNIALVAGNNFGGPGFVSGHISQGAGKTAGGDAVANAVILLLDMNDNAIQYTYSDANGDFELDNIAYGTYQLYAEVLNKETEAAIITISAENEKAENIELLVGTEKVIVSSTNEIAQELKGWNLYPNPSSKTIVLEFMLNSNSEIEIVLNDLLGKELIRQHQGMLSSGSQRFQIDISNLESGVYFINVFSNKERVKVANLFKN